MAERERDLERLLTFVDAVVAIAITLLVLPLAEVGSEVGQGTVAELLSEHVDDIAGFLLSFWVISRLWLAQHRIVSGLARQSRLVVWLLMVWTLTIVFLPFPTALVVNTDHDWLAKLLYIGTMTVSSVLLAGLARVIGRDRSLRDTDAAPNFPLAAGAAVALLLALLIALLFPVTSYWPLLLLVVSDPVVHRLQRRRATAGAAQP